MILIVYKATIIDAILVCDEIGRGNFLAVYVSCGVISSFMALLVPVLRRNFAISSLGASGAVCGIVATYFTLNSEYV